MGRSGRHGRPRVQRVGLGWAGTPRCKYATGRRVCARVDPDMVLNQVGGSSTSEPAQVCGGRDALPADLRRRFAARSWMWISFVACVGGFILVLLGLSWDSGAPVWFDAAFAAATLVVTWGLIARTPIAVSISSEDALLSSQTRLGRRHKVEPIVGSSLRWSLAYVVPIPEKTLFIRVCGDAGAVVEVPVAAAISPARRRGLRDLHAQLENLRVKSDDGGGAR